ncbi:MAG: hypothetical protein DFNUSKGM_000623 [Candidatus Fervidibacter sacchari]
MADLNRREFLKQVASIGVGTTLLEKTQAVDEQTSPPIPQVVLGKTGIKVSLVGLGTGMRGWMRQSNHTRMGYPAFERLVKHAYERGINFFNTADLYGTHTFLRDAPKGIPREKFVIQTKIWFMPQGLPEVVTDAKAAVDRFRKELDTDYIDIVLLHCTMRFQSHNGAIAVVDYHCWLRLKVASQRSLRKLGRAMGFSSQRTLKVMYLASLSL